MKKMCFLLSFCLCLSAQLLSQELVFKVNIKDADTLFALVTSIGKSDSFFTTNGSFTFRNQISEPNLFTISLVKGKQSIEAIRAGNEKMIRSKEDIANLRLFLDKGETIVSSKFADFGSSKSSNHVLQDKYDEFFKRFNPLINIKRTIIDSSYLPGLTPHEKRTYTMLYNKVDQVQTDVAQRFAGENRDNMVGAYILYYFGRTENLRQLDSLYRLFSPQLQASAYLKNIHDKIQAMQTLKPGQQVPAFAMVTDKGKNLTMADMLGKYVVLDFWGSWCAPCISGFPKMKEYYSKHQKKVLFVGIACNDKEAAWKTAIDQYALNWLHVFDTDKSNIAAAYNVEAYPTKVIIDRNGKFIQSFKGESNEFYQKLDELLGTP